MAGSLRLERRKSVLETDILPIETMSLFLKWSQRTDSNCYRRAFAEPRMTILPHWHIKEQNGCSRRICTRT